MYVLQRVKKCHVTDLEVPLTRFAKYCYQAEGEFFLYRIHIYEISFCKTHFNLIPSFTRKSRTENPPWFKVIHAYLIFSLLHFEDLLSQSEMSIESGSEKTWYIKDKFYVSVKGTTYFRAANLILLILLFVFTFMQAIYTYIPETKHVSRVYSVAAFRGYNLDICNNNRHTTVFRVNITRTLRVIKYEIESL